MYTKSFLLALAASVTAPFSPRAHGASDDGLSASTSSGRVHGKIDPRHPDVRQFLGIPFAAPPIGNLRYAPPKPLSQPEIDVYAYELGPSCMQYLNTASPSVYNDQVLEFNLQGLNRTGNISEDCLKLSIWAPRRDSSSRQGWSKRSRRIPVVIYLYGGGFSRL